MLNPTQYSANNLEVLSRNSYPGRGIIVGLDDLGQNLIQVYWIMGRGGDSRNRVFSVIGTRVFTEYADPAKVKKQDPNLLYTAMNEFGAHGKHVVSNGIQTNQVVDNSALREMGLLEALRNYKYEDDKPNCTPRITGVSYTKGSVMADLAILRKSPYDDSCRRTLYRYETIPPGVGYCITTYLGNGDPLPSWEGDPKVMPLIGTIDDIAECYWEALDVDNKVSLAVKSIPLLKKPTEPTRSKIVIRNKYERVG